MSWLVGDEPLDSPPITTLIIHFKECIQGFCEDVSLDDTLQPPTKIVWRINIIRLHSCRLGTLRPSYPKLKREWDIGI